MTCCRTPKGDWIYTLEQFMKFHCLTVQDCRNTTNIFLITNWMVLSNSLTKLNSLTVWIGTVRFLSCLATSSSYPHDLFSCCITTLYGSWHSLNSGFHVIFARRAYLDLDVVEVRSTPRTKRNSHLLLLIWDTLRNHRRRDVLRKNFLLFLQIFLVRTDYWTVNDSSSSVSWYLEIRPIHTTIDVAHPHT